MARTFTPNTSSLHYKLASLDGMFSVAKPRTLCGYVLAVCAPLFYGALMIGALFLSCVWIGGGFLLLSGLYTQDNAGSPFALIALGTVFAYLTLLIGSMYAADTWIGRVGNAWIGKIDAASQAVFQPFQAFTCTTAVDYKTDSQD